MSGNFDYPPASGNNASNSSPAAQSTPSVSARFRHLREMLNSERVRNRRTREADRRELLNFIDDEDDDAARERNRQRLRSLEILDLEESNMRHDEQRRRASLLDRATRPPSSSIARDSQGFVAPSSLSSSSPPRVRARYSGRYHQRLRQRADQRQASSFMGLVEGGARLAEATSSLSALIQDPLPRMDNSDFSNYVAEDDGNRWRAKRRKLDADATNIGFHGFQYGHFGQVVPGLLKMEIYSCDGGAYSEPFGEMSAVENVLIDDTSVYCTKADLCNIILQHQGQTTFDLRKLVIKSPQNDFDAPIQEGMIFVSMNPEELLTRTAHYQIRYTVDPRPGAHDRRRGISRHQGIPQTVSADPTPFFDLDSEEENQYHNQPATNHNRHPTPAPDATLFQVTADAEDKSDAEDDEQGQTEPHQGSRRLIPRSSWLSPYPQRGSDSSDSEEDDDESDENNPVPAPDAHPDRLHRAPSLRSEFNNDSRRRNIPSLIEPASPYPDADSHGNGPAERASPNVMAPHARFFIERNKSMVSLKFDPPVSGRFLLVKMWSPYSGGNIDIQSIVAHGYAGPRFFPSMELQ